MLNEPLGNILNELRNSVGLYAKCQLYGILIKQKGINYEINGVTGIFISFFFLHSWPLSFIILKIIFQFVII